FVLRLRLTPASTRSPCTTLFRSQAQPWTGREATGAQQVPESLAIIGGGVVGVEMATAYAALGARVTVLARHGLLERMEPFAGERDRKSTRLNSSHVKISYAVFCL